MVVSQQNRPRFETGSGTPQKITSITKYTRVTTKIGKTAARTAQTTKKKGQVGPQETTTGRVACRPAKKRMSVYGPETTTINNFNYQKFE
jgi:hypothetical protein